MKAVYAGSFDPLTNGHLWMIHEGVKLFGDLVVSVGINPDKKYTFGLCERLAMMNACIKDISNVSVDRFENMFLVNYAESIGARYILRGIRSEVDYEYERGMRYINDDLNHEIQTVFIIPPREIAEVSSSLVKGLIGPQHWEKVVAQYVPEPVYNALIMKFADMHPDTPWKNLCSRIGHPDLDGVWYWRIEKVYSEHSRAYHKLSHILDCLRQFEFLREASECEKAVELAIWFHDAVYDTHASNNEEMSAEFAREIMEEMTLPTSLIGMVIDLILATKHNSRPDTQDQQIIMDVDLAILGQPQRQFDEYESAIREEYRWVSVDMFRTKRTEILNLFLAQKTIYYTETFRDRYEQQARENIQRSIRLLTIGD